MEREHRAFGFPFPETPVRMAMFAEQLEIVSWLWTEKRVAFRGEHYTLEDAPGLPKLVQRPRPPLIVGGSGTRGTADPAARFADEYNTPFPSPADFAAIRGKESATCERVGRDTATMTLLDDDRLPDRLDARRGIPTSTRAARTYPTRRRLRRLGLRLCATRA